MVNGTGFDVKAEARYSISNYIIDFFQAHVSPASTLYACMHACSYAGSIYGYIAVCNAYMTLQKAGCSIRLSVRLSSDL